MKIVSVAGMRMLDKRTIASGVPAELLMERAGVGAFREFQAFLERRVHARHRRRVAVVAGKGNNGGDAYVVARCVHEHARLPVTVYAVCARTDLQGACRHHADALGQEVPVVVCAALPDAATAAGTVLVDGLLGTGSAGPPRPPYDRLIAQINASNLPVVALDIPSGLDADTGAVVTSAIVADLTVTMGLPKSGMLTEQGLTHCGAIRCVDIGIPPEFVQEAESCGEAVFAADMAPLLARRPHGAHKGTFGHVLVAGGSSLYVGAPFLAGAAALRSGAGLSTVAVPAAAREVAVSPLHALIVRAVPDGGTGFFCEAGRSVMASLLEAAQAVVFGPGIGQGAEAAPILGQLLDSSLPVVVDADGLRLLAQQPARAKRSAPTVLTPHPGEMKALLAGFRLDDYISVSRPEQARALAQKAGVYVVLKGMGTIIARPDGQHAVNVSGTSGLSTAGTGDVLAGLLGGLLAQKFSPWDALRLGVFLHGYAAELAADGTRALVADDLLELIGRAYRELTPFA